MKDKQEDFAMQLQVKLGHRAPEFTCLAYDPADPLNVERQISLADYAGRWLVFFWYPLNFSTVCPTEINMFSDRIEDFEMQECSVLGASTDSVYSHRGWSRVCRNQNGIEGLRYPLLSDQSHRTAREYGVLVEEKGIAERGLFIIDPEGIVRYVVLHSHNVGRSVDETIRVLMAIQSGGMCASEWMPDTAY